MMGKELHEYFFPLINEVPHDIYRMMLILFCVGTLIVLFSGFRKGWRYLVWLLLLEYVYLIYASTVLFRPIMRELNYNFKPFWSYMEIANGRTELLWENIMNVIMFVPIGILIGSQSRNKKKGWLVAFFMGLCLSVGIEIMQYMSQKGFSEVDDVMHNTLGCLIGYGACLCVVCIYKMGTVILKYKR